MSQSIQRGVRGVLIASLVLLFALSAFAQDQGFGRIEGVVLDPSNAVVKNAKVTVENPSKGIRRDLTTNADGVFNAPALVPAEGYQVTVNATGFAPYQVKAITLQVGQSVTLRPVLKIGTQQTVEVSAAAPMLDLSKTDVSGVVGSTQMLELPINGRRVDNFVLLMPGVVNDQFFGLLSFRGNPGGNTFLTDGNDTTNQYYNENAGRTRTYNISQDAVQEFQVITSNYAAEYGRASGGVVNTVTRSGSNNFHGTAYEFFRNRNISATDFTTKVPVLYPNGINPPEYRHQAGVSVGGPIVKNKLFFFVNGELTRRDEPAVSSNLGAGSGNNLFGGDGTFKSGLCTTATTAQCTAAQAYVTSRVLPQLVSRSVETNLFFAKFDYNLSSKDSLSFSTNYLDFHSPNGIQTQVSLATGNAIGNNGTTTVFDRTGRASWTRIVSPNAVNELRFGIFKDRQGDPAASGSTSIGTNLMPSFGPAGLTVASVSYLGFATSYPRLNPSELRFQVADTYSWTKGKHTFKFGGDYAHVEDYVWSMGNRLGSYSYSSFNAFALDFSGNPGGAKNWNTFSQVFGTPTVDLAVNEFTVFAQDEFRVTPKLTVTAGLRYENTTIPQPKTCNSLVPQTCKIPSTSLNFAPRLGFSYALFPKTVLRGGMGMFYNRYTTSTIENMLLTNGVSQLSYSIASSNAAAGPVFPNILSAAPSGTVGGATVVYADPHWRNPYSLQGNLALQRELTKDMTLSVSYLWSRGAHLLQTYDANAPLSTASLTNYTFPICSAMDSTGKICTATSGSYTTPIYTKANRLNPAFPTQGIFALASGGNTYYNGLAVEISRKVGKWVQGTVAYTWSHAMDNNQGGGGNTLFGSSFATSVFNGNFAAEKGESSSDQRHRLVLNAIFSPVFTNSKSFVSKTFVNGWQFGLVQIIASSLGQVPTIYVNDAAVSASNWAGPAGSTIMSFSSLNGLGGSSRVPWEALNYVQPGEQFRTDLRVSKTFGLTEKIKMALGFEGVNVLNSLLVSGRETRQYQTYKQPAGSLLAGQVAIMPYTQFNTITNTQVAPDGTTARRMQASARFTW